MADRYVIECDNPNHGEEPTYVQAWEGKSLICHVSASHAKMFKSHGEAEQIRSLISRKFSDMSWLTYRVLGVNITGKEKQVCRPLADIF